MNDTPSQSEEVREWFRCDVDGMALRHSTARCACQPRGLALLRRYAATASSAGHAPAQPVDAVRAAAASHRAPQQQQPSAPQQQRPSRPYWKHGRKQQGRRAGPHGSSSSAGTREQIERNRHKHWLELNQKELTAAEAQIYQLEKMQRSAGATSAAIEAAAAEEAAAAVAEATLRRHFAQCGGFGGRGVEAGMGLARSPVKEVPSLMGMNALFQLWKAATRQRAKTRTARLQQTHAREEFARRARPAANQVTLHDSVQ